jgi:hypothetical protein
MDAHHINDSQITEVLDTGTNISGMRFPNHYLSYFNVVLVFAQKCEKIYSKKGISHNRIYYIYVLVTNSANCFIKPMGLYTEV